MIPLRRKRRIIDDVAQNILLSTLAVVAPAAPFSQTEWPNPEPVNRSRQVADVPNLLGTTLAEVPPSFGQVDWQNPVAIRRQVAADVPQNLLLTTLAIPANQPEWENPPTKRRALQTNVSQNLLGTTLEATASPFNQTDWPQFRAAVRRQIEQVPNLIETVLATVHVIPPSQTDWPNPIMRRPLTPEFIGFMNPADMAAATGPFNGTFTISPLNNSTVGIKKTNISTAAINKTNTGTARVPSR